MTRKAKIVIETLSVIASALVAYWLWLTLKDVAIVVTMFVGNFLFFFLTFAAFAGIIYKKNVKFSKYMLGVGLSAIITFVSLVLGLNKTRYLLIIFVIAFIMLHVFLSLAFKRE